MSSSLRPVMMRALLQKAGEGGLQVTQAAGAPEGISPQAVAAMRQRGLAATTEPPLALDALGDLVYDLVIELADGLAEDHKEMPASEAAPHLRPLLVGDPVLLRWTAPPLGPGADKDPALLRGLLDDLDRRCAAILGHGVLNALMAQRQRTHRFMDALGEGIVAHDEFRCICLFNRAAEELTGYSRDEVLGKDCHQVFSPDGLCGSSCLFASGPRRVDQLTQYSTTYTSRDGVTRHVKMSVRPISMGAGRVNGVMAVVHDVTEEQELRWRANRPVVFHGTVGLSRAIQDIFTTVRQVSASDYPVLITGESGTGKELVARAVHEESRRRERPFVPINCGALPENILESELFGHVRGAFTGAIRGKKGRFELAHKGTLFLDEVGELSQTFQVKLLRVLQEKRFEMVGGERSISVDVRIISATNRDLRRLVASGQFREDLFYRLCVVPIHLPPLRERLEDLPLLVDHFLSTIREEIGKPIRAVATDALDQMTRHPWPGNIRELINCLQFAAVRCQGEEIQLEHLPLEVRGAAASEAPGAALPAGKPPSMERPPSRFKLDENKVRAALATARGNKVAAARILGVGRATLYRYLNREAES